MKLPKEKQDICNNIVNDLRKIEHIAAIVLGGSYATGHATETSDLDIALYYFNDTPFDIEKIKAVSEKYAIGSQPTVTGFYQWGPWVNGGAWMNTISGKVDFLYRNIEQVQTTIEKAHNGKWENHFEQQPPYGFSSVIYLAETKSCIPLYDPTGVIENLKAEVQTYPAKLKQTIIQDALWAAEFTLLQIETFAKKQDVYNTAGCLTRATKSIINALFAINELYPIGDKKAIEILEQADKHPKGLAEKVEKVLFLNKGNLTQNVLELRDLFEQTVALTNGTYQSLYKF